jgi:hypothetical protein
MSPVRFSVRLYPFHNPQFLEYALLKTIIMKNNRLSLRMTTLIAKCAIIILAVIIGVITFSLDADAQRRSGGSSFGGARRSSPSYAPSRPSAPAYGSRPMSPAPSRSFGGSRSGSSFGNSRSMTNTMQPAAANYRRSYGVPRQSMPYTPPGGSQSYIVHNYGNGFTHGLMLGYLAGNAMPFYYHMPFHPAFYYSSPTVVTNPNGTREVYPPTFSFFKLFLGLAIVGGVIWLIVRFIRRRSSGDTPSQSSFA